MGLTSRSTGAGVLNGELKMECLSENDIVIALAGNPNVGKSTVFNGLTGLNQHTGNWPGKTVTNAQGKYKHKDKNFILVDLPGTYSLMSNSVEEEIARDYICFGNADATIIVTDATCLERNLNLVLQTLEITSDVVVCVNLMDEAKRKKINIDLKELSEQLGVPAIGTSARSGKGLKALMDAVYENTNKKGVHTPLQITYDDIMEEAVDVLEPDIKELVKNKLNSRWVALKLIEGDEAFIKSLQKHLDYNIILDNKIQQKINEAREKLGMDGIDHNMLRDRTVSHIVGVAEEIGNKVISYENEKYNHTDRKIDRILTSRVFGIPIMIGLLGVIFWITMSGANVPSKMLADFLFRVQDGLTEFFTWAGTPSWVHGVLVLGIYRTLAWVISVMLPPMAIFFPLFTLLEDLGYLPRVAFNLDNFFKKACASGKQALTMCMGFGCNAAGVIGCRIIDSPRERLIAIITNNFVPCNGRFPTLIAIITMFFAGAVAGPFQSIISTLLLTGVIVLGVCMTLFISKILSKTILKGLPSSFTLELPPYRKPQIGRVIVRSIFDRTLFVLGRAIVVAVPAGLIIWLLANIYVGDLSVLSHCAGFLDPFAKLLGLDGYILMAFILGFPANEIVVPIIIMSYMATGNLLEMDSLDQLRELLVSHGWTWVTAVCTMLFSLMHWPCGTTCLTIKKEAGSWKWTVVSFLVPTITGMTICFIFANTVRLISLI
ncbi:ferrous iron transport protein B [Konateibacter massiliensis]|uniref:ferrous iron transport protein B n=1 Tax=Konateibacter massiliensis TaxID=2002841 RepID=UPI000C1492DB|nr:ferrous iron transport protein B [Konateibacter massiliensis]